MQADSIQTTKLAQVNLSSLSFLKQWGKSAYKCTKQIVSEKLGKCNKTVDPELDLAIENLRDIKTKYEKILELCKKFTHHFQHVLHTQRAMADSFAELARTSPEMIEEFTTNAEIQRSLIKNGEKLINEIRSFTSNLSTLCFKTIQDTIITINNYEAARLEFDAYRTELERLQLLPFSDKKDQQISQLEIELRVFKERFEKYRKDVAVKLKFLDENRIKVMRKQLTFFHTAVTSYFAGNQNNLEITFSQINSTLNMLKNDTSDSGFKLESFLDSTSIN